jgi:hypothetical protein
LIYYLIVDISNLSHIWRLSPYILSLQTIPECTLISFGKRLIAAFPFFDWIKITMPPLVLFIISMVRLGLWFFHGLGEFRYKPACAYCYCTIIIYGKCEQIFEVISVKYLNVFNIPFRFFSHLFNLIWLSVNF